PEPEPKPIPEPKPESEPEPVASPVHSDAPPALAQVKAKWREMINHVGEEHRNLPPLLNMGKPLALEGSAIILGFDFPIFKEKFTNTAGAAEIIGEAFSDLLQTHCQVRAVVTSEYTVPIAEDEFRALANELGGVVREEE
ncbi:MAG: hypothetical protein ACE5FD_09860, partial [Anaerolineae bacterium]